MEKKYTLYFKGINKYDHEHNLPIVSLGLKQLDLYTSNYENYYELFNCLPKRINYFIKENLLYRVNTEDKDAYNDLFFITDNDFNPIMSVIFEEDEDVLYVTQEEIDEMIINEKMSYLEFRTSLFNLKSKSHEKKKYDFFRYLYETYVEKRKIECMIDTYDANSKLPDLPKKELMIAALATSKDNIMVLCRKLCQNDEARRNLAFKYKELFKKLYNSKNMIKYKTVLKRKTKNNSFNFIGNMMLENFDEFKKKYEKEYTD